MHGKKINLECRVIRLKNNRLIYRFKECKKEWKKVTEELIEKFLRVYQFCKGDFNKFVFLLRKGVYPYECMDSWEKFDETTLPPKSDFYSELTLKGISSEYYANAQKVWKVFEIKYRGDYHDLHVQSDTLLVADIYENVRNMS